MRTVHDLCRISKRGDMIDMNSVYVVSSRRVCQSIYKEVRASHARESRVQPSELETHVDTVKLEGGDRGTSAYVHTRHHTLAYGAAERTRDTH